MDTLYSKEINTLWSLLYLRQSCGSFLCAQTPSRARAKIITQHIVRAYLLDIT